ncbi:THUMP domain-containing protein 3-like isoform X2 [Homarus americanus]|nr:THUMP domain-containing protein 3-like isoform X2 [Homarus americanus]XP_042231883.1 THUMP domain-containing protein 3-like isoform X2 [Homarus americanus]XP_042231884.1 THUMP domain-containing protein 3-like isoform X2 [Homarus americanus]XP_042231885.1 THUMP domain-containing protein 3-like isoform X2 [Homarus americanus]
MVTNFSFPDNREQCFQQLYKFAEKPDWRKGMSVWKNVFSFPEEPIQEVKALNNDYCKPRPDIDLKRMKLTSQIIDNIPEGILPQHLKKKRQPEEEQTNAEINSAVTDTTVESEEDSSEKQRVQASGPKFRISCNRTGTNHNFGSSEAARQFGGAVNEMFGWPVDLSCFELEILLYIDTEFVYVGVCLTREPLFKRNLTNFGRTNLRSTICYNMVRLAAPQPGEVIVDPLCGGATIPMEGSLTYSKVLHLGGDNFGQAVKRSRDNIDYLVKKGKSMPIDVAQWDAARLPLRNQCVDIIVSDLPFGKRIGSKGDNRVLYYNSLLEMARITRTGTGRAVLLTHDRNSMMRNIKRVHTLWKSATSRTINIGGLSAVIYILHRTALLFDPNLKIASKTHKKPSEPGEF